MPAGIVNHLGDFRLGDLISKDPTDTHAPLVDMQHDTRRLFPALAEELLQDVDDELLWRVIIVQHQDLIHRRLFRLRLGLYDDTGFGITIIAFVLAHLTRLLALVRALLAQRIILEFLRSVKDLRWRFSRFAGQSGRFPAFGGAGVVGLAIGFGAQMLVKDVVAGVFFLIDDAFRVGENIEMGDIRGEVEVHAPGAVAAALVEPSGM